VFRSQIIVPITNPFQLFFFKLRTNI